MSRSFERCIVLKYWAADHKVDKVGLPIDPPQEIDINGKVLAFSAFDVVVTDEDGNEILRCGPSHKFANWMIEGFVRPVATNV